jgi:hypothetical protein
MFAVAMRAVDDQAANRAMRQQLLAASAVYGKLHSRSSDGTVEAPQRGLDRFVLMPASAVGRIRTFKAGAHAWSISAPYDTGASGFLWRPRLP